MSFALSPAMPDYAVAGDDVGYVERGLRLTTNGFYETSTLCVKPCYLKGVTPAVVNHVTSLFFGDWKACACGQVG